MQAGSQADLITQRYGYDAVERLAQIKYLKAEGTADDQLIEQRAKNSKSKQTITIIPINPNVLNQHHKQPSNVTEAGVRSCNHTNPQLNSSMARPLRIEFPSGLREKRVVKV